MWIFGYGSIIWKPDFEFVHSIPGWVDGWTRRFYQHSTDHRGVPGSPGRVVTLLEQPGARCWGMAYRVPDDEAERIRRQLDEREKGGYERHMFEIVSPREDERLGPALTYVATSDNDHWAGPASPEAIARQAATSSGPSGHNAEYVLELAEHLRTMGAEDDHVFEVESALRDLLAGDDQP